ncbi:reverse transcriptase domain-containing protein [Tanacetum coccineum]
MTGVPRSIAEHRLNVREGCQPIRQKRRGQAPDRNKAIQEEVAKLVEAEIIREVHYHDWLSNPVMVKKHDEIDWKVESLYGYPFKCFLDAYKGCHQIQMAEEDEEKMAFHTNQGVSCYTKMSFGLKNAGATYQRLVDKAFEKQIGRNLEVCVDDLVIKSHTDHEILRDVEETFHNLRRINMKLNPKKCTFCAEEGAFLGHVINMQGIKACPDKTEAVMKLQSPQTLKEAQSLNGKLESLNGFLSKSAEKSLPFFKTLKSQRSSKHSSTSGKGLAAGTSLFRQPCLANPEINYSSMEKLVLALVHATRRLRRYFQAHPVVVITDQPIKQILSRPENTGRMLKWKFELEAFDITYRPRTSIRGQILADFIAEKPNEEGPSEEVQAKEAIPEPWTLFTDGSSCLEGSGAGLILTSPEGEEFTYALRFEFDASNNEAEYEALVAGLQIAEQMGVKNLIAKVDSRLVENQINGLYQAKEQSMTQYLEKAKTLINNFKMFSIEQVPRSENKKAGALSKIASTSFAYLTKQVLVETLKRKSIEEREILIVVEEGHFWMTPLIEYPAEGTLPAETKKARTVKIKARGYTMVNGVLYRKSFLEPWLWCVGPTQAEYMVKEIHEGSCNMHSGPRSVVAKSTRSGYYWPTMHKDARNIIRKCDDCQTHRPVPRNPQQKLTSITSSWPFYKWGIDISGPFPEAQGKVKFLIVAIDYFTKWIEAKPVATITESQVKKFVWDNIVCRFGLPGEIISDNGKQFRDNPFKDWCEKLNIKQRFTSVKHPQTNGQVERANRSLGEGIKARLREDNRNWVEEVPHVLWAHHTMIKTSNGDTLFSLTYGTEAVIPVEIGMPSLRCAKVNQAENDEGLLLNLDILEERREKAAVREARNKAKMEKYYNAKVRNTSFRPGDFVYRNNKASHAKEGGKLGPKWEGPYEVVEALGKGAYKLRNRSGDILPRTWNVQDLKSVIFNFTSCKHPHQCKTALAVGEIFIRSYVMTFIIKLLNIM